MTDFLKKYSNSQVETMRLNGGIVSKFDEFGNLLISSNETNIEDSVITVPLYGPQFSSDSIFKLVDTNFKEFFVQEQTQDELDSQSDLKSMYDNQVEENQNLRDQLDELTLKVNDPEKISDELKVKDTIIQLRISLGEGSIESDFHDEFPYTAIQKLT